MFDSHADLEKLRQRDPQFLAQLFREVNPGLLRMMATKKIYAENAEEIVHECWETFFSNLEKFEGRSQLKTFIFGILMNKIRENQKRMARVDFEEDSEKVFERRFTKDGWWAQEPQNPDKLLQNRQLKSQIHDCMEGLTMDQRSAFLLVEFEGETSKQACELMGVKVSNLRVLIFRAKDKLRQCLEGLS